MSYANSDEENEAIDAAAERSFLLDDMERSYDMMAVFVIEELPTQVIARFLDANAQSLGHPFLWLVDTYENLPDYTGKLFWGPMDVASDWRSPWVGKSLDDVGEFVKNIDVTTKAMSRNYFAVLLKGSNGQDYRVLICKTPNEAVGRTEVQHTEYQTDKISSFFVAFDDDNWDVMMEEQGQL